MLVIGYGKISYLVVTMIDRDLMRLVLKEPKIRDIYKLNSNPNLDEYELPYSKRGIGELYWINVYVLANKCKEWMFEEGFELFTGKCSDDGTWMWSINPNDGSAVTIDFCGRADTEYEAVFDACKFLMEYFKNESN